MATTSRRRVRNTLTMVAAAALVGSLLPAAAEAADDTSGPGTKTVSFRDASVTVPDAWPVHDLAGRPGCVRFDRHAVYLGDPSRSTCPPHLVGRTEAVHLTTGSLQGVVAPGPGGHLRGVPGRGGRRRRRQHARCPRDRILRDVRRRARGGHRSLRPRGCPHLRRRDRGDVVAAAPPAVRRRPTPGSPASASTPARRSRSPRCPPGTPPRRTRRRTCTSAARAAAARRPT